MATYFKNLAKHSVTTTYHPVVLLQLKLAENSDSTRVNCNSENPTGPFPLTIEFLTSFQFEPIVY